MIRLGAHAGLIGVFFVFGISFLMLYSFRPNNRELLCFSLFFWTSLVFWATHDEKLLFQQLPGIPYGLQVKIQSIPSPLIFASLLGFVNAMYPGRPPRLAVRVVLGAGGALAVFFAVAPTSAVSGAEIGLAAYDLIAVLYAIQILVRAFYRGSRDSIYSLLAAGCIMNEGIFEGLYYLGLDDTPGMYVPEKLLFIMIMAFVIAKRFFAGMKEIETLSQRLLVADRLKNDFLVTTSQEIQLPLHGMINIAEVMLNADDLTSERHRERLRLLMSTGRQLSSLLNDMLDLSKLNEGAIELERRPLDLRMLVGGVTEVMRYLKDGSAVRFANQVASELPCVWADEHRMTQILFHLFHYAVGWGAQGDIRIDAGVRDGSGGVNLEITARGGGNRIVPKMALDRMEAGIAPLSMEISRKLLELHGSGLEVVHEGEELRIRFSLPAAGEESEPAPTLRALDEAAAGLEVPAKSTVRRHVSPGAPRVLVVDNDSVSLRVIFDLLVQEKLDVTALTDGEEALRLIEHEGGWDLLVLETMLSRISGYDLCREVRRSRSFYDLPVLFLTTRNMPAFLMVGLDAGANDSITKPIQPSEFLAKTRMLLHMKRSIRERLEIEMALIQAQIKPHFLYNTLNTIASLSEIDPDRTRELLADFGSYLQHSFDLRNLDSKVPFEKEWALVHSYLHIEKARFGERIRIVIDIPENVSFSLPPLTIQPLVENALKHGILKRLEGGWLCIRVSEEKGGFRISVRDNGIGIPPAKRAAILEGTYRDGIGLVNVNRRLKNAYGQGLSIDSIEGEGTEISFRIPIPQDREGLRHEGDRD
jgi:signal transduction histidine kinase